jgi:hypothetical protein
MYNKPSLTRFGSFRQLTQVGFGADGDGGIFGSGFLDGCDFGCNRS